MPRVNIEGVGQVNFPDDMTSDQIQSAIETDILPQPKSNPLPKSAAVAPNPTEGNSFLQNARIAFGKEFSDLSRGAKQVVAGAEEKILPEAVLSGIRAIREKVGIDSRGSKALADEAKEYENLDKPLMQTAGGIAGNIAGKVATTLPILAIPGINTYAGSAIAGAGLGSLQPTQDAELFNKDRLTNTALGGVVSVAGKFAADKLGSALFSRASKKTADALIKKGVNTARDSALEAGKKLGYVVPPSQANPNLFNRATNWIGGKAATEKLASMKNAQLTEDLMRQAVGLSDDTPLTAETLKGVRSKAGEAYEALKGAGKITTDEKYLADLAAITKRFEGAAKDFPELAKNEIGDIVESVKKNNFSADSAIDAISVIQDKASKAFAQGDRGLAKAYGAVKKSLEDVIERNLNPKSDLFRNYTEARQLIAKAHSVEKAINSRSGAATELARQLEKGKPLSGELKTIAEYAKQFPKATQADVSKLGSLAGTGYFDTLASSALAAGTGNPLMLAGVTARPLARAIMLSKGGQKLLANPSYSEPLATKLAAALLKNQDAQLLLPIATRQLIQPSQQ